MMDRCNRLELRGGRSHCLGRPSNLHAHRPNCQANSLAPIQRRTSLPMITIVQRVSEAKVTVGGEVVGAIGPGLLALAAVMRSDTEKDIDWTAAKLAVLRIFRSEGKHFDK